MFEPPCAGFIFFLNKLSMPLRRASTVNLRAGKHRPAPACVLKLLQIRPRVAQCCAPCGSSWKQLLRRAVLHHPCQFEGGLLVDGRPKRKCLKESMVLQVQNPHTRIGTLNPCFLLSLIQMRANVRMMVMPKIWLSGRRLLWGAATTLSFF